MPAAFVDSHTLKSRTEGQPHFVVDCHVAARVVLNFGDGGIRDRQSNFSSMVDRGMLRFGEG